MDDKRYEALEQALTDLSAGEDKITVINGKPGLEGEIETSQLLGSLSPESIPATTMQRSRTRILSHAQKLRQESGSMLGLFWRKPKFVYAIILAVSR